MASKRKGCLRMITVVFLVVVTVIAIWAFTRVGEEFPPQAADLQTSRHRIVAVFGVTGDVGDGILEAVMADPEVEKIHLITRRMPWRIDGREISDRIVVTTHMDYLDYGPLRDILAEVDAVFWAIGTSAANVDKEQYGVIHVDFPVAMVDEWLGIQADRERSFHFVSGGGAALDSRMHWAREKARAEKALFELTDGTGTRVIAYRPGAVIPAKERGEKNDGLKQAMRFLVPLKLGVRSVSIGEAMIEITARGDELDRGSILENDAILMYANGYRSRLGMTP